MSKNKLGILLIACLISFSCEAPRENPLDPEGENYHSIEGYVQTFSLPYSPLPDVSVYWAASNALVKTDSSGKFLIGNASPVNGYLVFQKQGYRTDSLFVVWGSSKTYPVQISLNKIPVMESSSIFTSVINNADSTRNFEVVVRVKINDEDKDIDSVIVENSKLNVRKSLEYDIINKYYQVNLGSDEVSISDIEGTIGEDFNFYVVDIAGLTYMVGKDRVTRVIRTGATVISPDNTTVNSLPVLSWKKYQPGYSLNYSVEVYKNDPGNPQLIVRETEIPMDTTSLQVKTSLAPADYFWVIWTMDSFNNNSRSRPALFSVR